MKVQLLIITISLAAANVFNFPIPATAGEFTAVGGAVQGSIKSTLSYGAAWRVGNPANDLKGIMNGGNQKFDSGDLVANRFTGTHELSFKWSNVEGFFRGHYYYDQANDRKNFNIIDPSGNVIADGRDADARAVKSARLLDAYIKINMDTLNLRVGRQVISWGESTFIGGSINSINAIDVSNLRTPGSRLKNALLPTPAVHASWALNEAVTLETFYLLSFDRTLIDPAGTFWNSATFVADGGRRLGPLVKSSSNQPEDSGQYGVAVRYFSPTLLNDVGFQGFDFGLYYTNIHSHTGYLSVVRGVPGTASYFIDFPEGIETYGASFNTQVLGWAWGGEMSHRPNAPVQMDGFVGAALGSPSQLTPHGPVGIGTKVKAWERLEVNQIQTTLQRIFIPHAIGADTGSVLIEAAYNWVNDRPALKTFEPLTDSSWGYQVRLSTTYNRAIAGVVNLSPTLAFRHDVRGRSSEVGGSRLFIDGRKAVSVGVNWTYLARWSGGISATASFGGKKNANKNSSGGPLFGGRDRRWVGFSVAYDF